MSARRFGLRAWLAFAAPVALLAIGETDARAGICDAGPFASTCINSDTLWPHAGPSRFFAIGSTETVAPGQIGFGLVSTYLSRPIVLKLPSPGPSGSDAYAINDQVNGTFLWALGVTKRLELDFALPITFGQGGTGVAPLTTTSSRLQDTAIRDLRFGAMYALVPRTASAPFALAARFEVSAPTGDKEQFAGERGAVFVPSVVADLRSDRFFAAGEAGLRVRPTAKLEGVAIGTQLAVAVGAGFDVLRDDKLAAVLEARALPTFASQGTLQSTPEGTVLTGGGKAVIPAEWMLSVRTSPFRSGDFAIQAGGGGAIPFDGTPLTTPRFRFALSLRYAPTTRVDPGRPPNGAATPSLDLGRAPDVCGDDPDTVDGFKDDDGCPDEDADKDGIDDRRDPCPLVSEDFAGLQEGCPEIKTPAGGGP